MQLIQEYVLDNDNIHMEERAYGFRIIKSEIPGSEFLYDFSPNYDTMLIKKLPKGFKATRCEYE